MPLLARPHDPFLVRMRSSVPGRQRWDVGGVLDSPGTADRIESELGRRPRVRSVSANAVTGRVLVHHDGSVTESEVAAWLREATTPAAPATSQPPAPSAPARADRHRTGTAVGVVALVGAAAVGVTLLPAGPLLGLGVVAVATAAVVRSGRNELGSTESTRSPAEVVSRVVRGHGAQLAAASALSVLGQVAFLGMSAAMTSGMMLVLTGEHSTLTALGVIGTSHQVLALAATIGALGAVVGVLAYAAGRRWRRLGQVVEQDWRESTYQHAQQLELRHLEQEGAGRVATVLAEDPAALGRLFSRCGADVVQAAAVVVVLVPTFLLLEPAIAWAAIMPIPVIAWLSVRFHRRNSENLARSHAASAALTEHVASRIDGSATVKAFTAEGHEAAEVARLGGRARDAQATSDRGSALYAETVQMGAISTMVAMLAVGGRAVLAGTLPFGVFSATVGLPQNLIIRLPRLVPTVEAYQTAAGALDRLEHLRALPAEPLTVGRTPDPTGAQGELRLDGVTFAYPGQAPVLREMSLRVAPGAVTAIVGPSGSGKSTIAALLLRLRDPDSGRILLDGVDLRELTAHSVRDSVAFVSQEGRLFDGTVADNIRYGSGGIPLDRVVGAARLACADDFVRSLPEGYDTVIGPSGRVLSGGQRQRLTLARAMLKQAPIMILDEATSAMDNETEAAIGEALAAPAETRTRLVIAHRLSLVRHADQIYVLDEVGAVAEAGTHDDLVERDGRYASLWALQVGAGTV